MSAATITQAQDKGLRHQFDTLLGNLRTLAAGLYAAHGGWLAPARRAGQQDRAGVLTLADQAEAHSPSLSAELRFLASRG